MKTTFDLISVFIFAVLAVIYLHRSSRKEPDPVPWWGYALAAVACAAANAMGNAGRPALAATALAGVAGFIVWLLSTERRR